MNKDDGNAKHKLLTKTSVIDSSISWSNAVGLIRSVWTVIVAITPVLTIGAVVVVVALTPS